MAGRHRFFIETPLLSLRSLTGKLPIWQTDTSVSQNLNAHLHATETEPNLRKQAVNLRSIGPTGATFQRLAPGLRHSNIKKGGGE